MTPYYQHNNITIHHADCHDILPTIDPASVDLLLTDPPYGINYNPQNTKHKNPTSTHATILGDSEPFDPTHLLHYERIILWGGNCFADKLPPWPGWIAWDKVTQNVTEMRGAEVELAWTNFVKRPAMFRHLWRGAYRDSEHGQHIHPTQKPAALMRWILEKWTDPGDLILDPYMGSGPIAQAAQDLGRHYIGIEIEEQYCQAATNRLNQQVLPL